MFKKILGIYLVILFVAVQSEAAEPTNVGIEIIKFGESERVEKGQVFSAPDAANGLTYVGKIQFIKEGSVTIPAVKGKGMAVTFKVVGEPNGKEIVLEMRTIHPSMRNPNNGKTTTVSSWVSKAEIGTNSFRDYEFTEQWEVVAGEWIFEFWYEGNKLNSQNFIVN